MFPLLRAALLTLAALLPASAQPASAQPAPAQSAPAQSAPAQPRAMTRPALFLVGGIASMPDLHTLFDPGRITLIDGPAPGQTTRTYINSGAWDTLVAQVKPGDFVLIEFGPELEAPSPNARSTDDRTAATRTLHGAGDGTFDYLDPGTRKVELVHSYGWYLRKLVVDVINHGANPILCSPPSPAAPSAINRNQDESTYSDWARAIATEQRIPFADLGASSPALSAPAVRTALETLKPDPLAPYLARQ